MTRDELLAYLSKQGIEHTTYDHEPVFTVAESAHLKAHIPGGHTKNLFLKDDKKQFWLISAIQDTQINLRKLSKQIDAKGLRFAQPEYLRECLGVEPGSVTWFALLNDKDHRVNALLDKHLFDYDIVGFHPLKNDATTVVKPDNLITFAEAFGHNYRIYDFTE